MSSIWTIARREYNYYFSRPTGYVLLTCILVILGLYFYFLNSMQVFDYRFLPRIDMVINLLGVLLVLGAPAITARLWPDEYRSGTFELIITFPIKVSEFVLGKWLGATFFILTITGIAIVFPFVLNLFIRPGIHTGLFPSNIAMLVLHSAALAATGMAVSAFFRNRLAAFLVTLIVLVLVWWLVGSSGIFSTLGWLGRYNGSTLRGVVGFRDVAFYLVITVIALLVSTARLQSRRTA